MDGSLAIKMWIKYKNVRPKHAHQAGYLGTARGSKDRQI